MNQQKKEYQTREMHKIIFFKLTNYQTEHDIKKIQNIIDQMIVIL
jgi:hypothetical protein